MAGGRKHSARTPDGKPQHGLTEADGERGGTALPAACQCQDAHQVGDALPEVTQLQPRLAARDASRPLCAICRERGGR